MNDGSGCAVFILAYVVAFLSVFVTSRIYEMKPQAIEVYQGKTTLEYKIIDGEVIDSCVVYKNK
jgi:DMSO reductase anchor subunit